jgi:hypothetical protein
MFLRYPRTTLHQNSRTRRPIAVAVPVFSGAFGRNQIPQGQVVHHILDILELILEAIGSLSQSVVLQVQHLEAGVQVPDETTDTTRTSKVSVNNRVSG